MIIIRKWIHSPVQNADPVGNDYEPECEAEKKSKADSAAKIDFTSDGINLFIQLQTPIMIPEDKSSEVSNRNPSQSEIVTNLVHLNKCR